MRLKARRYLSILSTVLLVSVFNAGVNPAHASTQPDVDPSYNCTAVTFPAADDSSFLMNLPFSLKLGGTEYTQVFASTNGVLSFGLADTTYWDYPNTPSISLAGWDWVTWGAGAYLRYGTTANSLCIQWAVREYPLSSGDLTYFTLLVDREVNGNWSGRVLSNGWFPDTLRRGVRYQPNEPVVLISTTFSVGNGGVPVETHTCWNGDVIPVSEACPAEPDPTVEQRLVPCVWTNPYTNAMELGTAYQRFYLYWNGNTVDIDTQADACAAATPNYPEPLPVDKQRTITCSGVDTQGAAAAWEAVQYYKEYWDGRIENLETTTVICIRTDPNLNNVTDIVVLDNGVELTVDVAQALALFESPSDLLNAMFTNPGQVATAILNLGADMTPTQRKRAQRAIVSAIVVSQVITATSAVTLIKR